MPSPFAENFDILARLHPELARRLQTAAPSAAAHVEPARSGEPTLKFTLDGREVWLHSRFDPGREAESLAESVPKDAPENLVLGGLGLGYALEALLARFPGKQILVIEPDLGLLRVALEVRELAACFRSGRVALFAPQAVDEVAAALARLENDHIVRGFRVVKHLFCAARPALYEPMFQAFAEAFRVRAMQVASGVAMSRTSLSNALANLRRYACSRGPADFAGVFSGRPGILVGAGPSLSRNVNELARAKGRAVIFTVSTAMKAVLAEGISPDCTNVVDYHADSVRYFRDVPKESAPVLFADPRAHPGVLESWSGEVVMNEEAFLRNLLHDAGLPEHGSLTEGNTVAHHAFFLLQHMGCDPILLVGLDLGYPSYVTHVPKTAIYDEWQANTGPFSTFENQEMQFVMRYRPHARRWQDVRGDPIWSDRMMEAYALEFRRFIKESKTRVVHAVEGGVDLGAHETCTLREALDRYCNEQIDLSPLALGPSAVERDRRQKLAEEALGRRIEECGRYLGIQREAIRTLRAAQKRVTKGETALSDLQRKIEDLAKQADSFLFLREAMTRLASADAVHRLRQEAEAEAKGGDELTLYRRLVERELAYARGMERAAEDLRRRLETARAGLRHAATGLTEETR